MCHIIALAVVFSFFIFTSDCLQAKKGRLKQSKFNLSYCGDII